MASSPYGIAQVDVPGLLQQYEGMKRSRLEDLYRQRQYERQERADERQMKLDQRADTAYERGEKAREAIAGGAKPDEVIGIDPELGFNYAKHSASIAKDQREAAAQRADDVGSAAVYLNSLPDSQLATQWDAVLDKLIGAGYADLEAYKGKPDRARLGPIISASKDAVTAYLASQDKNADRALRERQLGVSEGQLGLARQREDRVSRWGPQPLIGMMPGGAPTGTSDLDY